MRTIIKKYRRSPTLNDDVLQPLVKALILAKEKKKATDTREPKTAKAIDTKQFILDVITRWNTLCDMLERFLYMRPAVDVCEEGVISAEDWNSLRLLVDTLSPVRTCVKKITKDNLNVLQAGAAVKVMMDYLDSISGVNPIARDLHRGLKVRFEERLLKSYMNAMLLVTQKNPVLSRKETNDGVNYLATMYDRLTDVHVDNDNATATESEPNTVTATEPEPQPPTTETVADNLDSDSNHSNATDLAARMDLAMSEANIVGVGSVTEPAVPTASLKVIKQELSLFKVERIGHEIQEQPPRLKRLRLWMATLQPTSIAPERAFSAVTQFSTPLRSRLSDGSLNAILFLREYYHNQKNVY